MEKHKTGEQYVGSRVFRCGAPNGNKEAVSRMFWTKEDADKVCTDLREKDPDHRYFVVHYLKEYHLVEEGNIA